MTALLFEHFELYVLGMLAMAVLGWIVLDPSNRNAPSQNVWVVVSYWVGLVVAYPVLIPSLIIVWLIQGTTVPNDWAPVIVWKGVHAWLMN